MKLFRENLLLVIFLFIGISVFSVLFYLILEKTEQTELIGKEIESEQNKQSTIREELASYENLSMDLKFCLEELALLGNLEKKQNIFWNNITNPRENLLTKWSEKTAEAVNADITRLFTTLRSRCKSAKIDLPSNVSKAPKIGFGAINKKPENNYGFSFTSYDGFWPSFSKDEAKKLGVQAKIVKELVEFITLSSIESQKLSIIEIQREYAGSVDQKYIENDQLNIGSDKTFLLRDHTNVKSLAFRVTLKGQSSHARKFINQLRPPFMLRKIDVKRELPENVPLKVVDDFIPNPFGDPGVTQPKPTQESLPIVKDVNSEFSFLIEYITSAQRDIELLFAKKDLWKNGNAEILEMFLTESGNSSQIGKIESLIVAGE